MAARLHEGQKEVQEKATINRRSSSNNWGHKLAGNPWTEDHRKAGTFRGEEIHQQELRNCCDARRNENSTLIYKKTPLYYLTAFHWSHIYLGETIPTLAR